MQNYDFLTRMVNWCTNSKALKFEFIRAKI